MKDLLERLQKAVDNLTAATGTEPTADKGTEVTFAQFVEYAGAQIEKAAKEEPAARTARLKHLHGQIDAVRKNWEGPTPAAGTVRIQMFKDPGQQVPTTETAPTLPVNATPANSAASTPTPPDQLGVGNQPPGGQSLPAEAGSSGFATPAEATFAKALVDLTSKLDEVLKGTPAATDEEPPKEGAAEATAETEDEKVEKGIGVIWPLDLNTPAMDDEEFKAPEFGYDPGSRAAEVLKANQGKADDPATK